MQEAIKFFEEELYQYSIMLAGVLRKEYRTYLEAKTAHYEAALSALRNSIEERKDNQDYYRRLGEYCKMYD